MGLALAMLDISLQAFPPLRGHGGGSPDGQQAARQTPRFAKLDGNIDGRALLVRQQRADGSPSSHRIEQLSFGKQAGQPVDAVVVELLQTIDVEISPDPPSATPGAAAPLGPEEIFCPNCTRLAPPAPARSHATSRNGRAASDSLSRSWPFP